MGQQQQDQDDVQNYSNSSRSSNGRPTKKQKQKKVPQRGLGVAELERIRLEEQQQHHQKVVARPTMESNQNSCQSTTTSSTFHKYPRQSFDQNLPNLDINIYNHENIINSSNSNNKYGIGSSSNNHNSSSSIPMSTQTWQHPPEKLLAGSSRRFDSDMIMMPPWNPTTTSSSSSAFPLWPDQYQHRQPILMPPSSSAISSCNSSKMNANISTPCTRTSSSSSATTGMRNQHVSNKSYYAYNKTNFATPLEEGDRNKLPITAKSSSTIGIKRAYHHHHQENTCIGGSGNDNSSTAPPPPHFMYHNKNSNNKQLLPSVVHHHHHHESPSSFNFGSGPIFNFSSHPPPPFFRDGWMGFSTDYLTNTLAPAPAPTTEATPVGGRVCSTTSSNFKLNDPHFHDLAAASGKKFQIDPPSISKLQSIYQHHHHHHQVKGRVVEDQGSSDQHTSMYVRMIQQQQQQQQQPRSDHWPHTALLMKDGTISGQVDDGNHPDKFDNLDLNLKL
ncbi:hypothetical protein LINGRAHAP2_LOCUS32735 [Linum grandiflorum]